MKTAELTGAALDWAVAKCEHGNLFMEPYSTSWVHGGPIIEREGMYLRANDAGTIWAAGAWAAGALRKNRFDKKPGPLFFAETPLIAAMRCYVASKLGDEVEIPEELK